MQNWSSMHCNIPSSTSSSFPRLCIAVACLSILAQQLQICENAVDDKQTRGKQLLASHHWPITATQTNLSRHPKKQWQTKRAPRFSMLKKHAVTGYSLGQTSLSESSLSVLHKNLSVLCQGQPSIEAVHYFNQLCRDTHTYTTTRSETANTLQEVCKTIKIVARASSKQRAFSDT